MWKKNLILSLMLISTYTLYANDNINTIVQELLQEELLEQQKEIDSKLAQLQEQVKGNIWINKYNNYRTYKQIEGEILLANNQLKRLQRKRKTSKVLKEIVELNRIITNKENKLELLQEYQHYIFGNLSKLKEFEEHARVTNPILVISAISHIKQINQQNANNQNDYQTLLETIGILKEREMLLSDMLKVADGITPPNASLKKQTKEQIKELQGQIKDFDFALDNFKTTVELFERKVEESVINLTRQIEDQALKFLYIILAIVFVFFVGFLIKFFIKKYMSKNKKITDRFYIINKVINISIVVISILTLFVSYLENVTYLITVLGFASAGIAIAMKDWFMSILGWFVMIIGGSIHVGDRIKVIRYGQEVVGDVLDISMLRITIYEDITLTTYDTIRRAGRIIFIPNHYIFTQVIFNYTHTGLKTVWDGIDFLITFDSDHQKASLIAKEIATRYSKGFTDISRSNLNRLRRSYNLRSTNVEPRIFSFIDPNGIKISVWYQTNSFATLTLRSTISAEILDRFLQEDDIQIGYQTQTLNLSRRTPKSIHVEDPIGNWDKLMKWRRIKC